MAELPMIPWHLPELRAAREELLRNMAYMVAMEDPAHRAAFERFKQAALSAPVGKRARR